MTIVRDGGRAGITPQAPPPAPSPADDHLMAFGADGWHVWREAVLRTAGFPAAGLTDLAAPEAAAAADAFLADGSGQDRFDRAYQAALDSGAERLAAVAADPSFVEAVTWQNPHALVAIEGLLRSVAAGDDRRNQRRWTREELISRYWQRYCGKNETVGFFGPILWTRLAADGPAVRAEPGRALVGHREVFFEYWALTRYADRLAADPAIRPYLPAWRNPHLAVTGQLVRGAGSGPVRLTAADAAVLSACDGRRAAVDLATELAASGVAGLRDAEDVLAQIEHLATRGLLHWGIDLPMDLTAESAFVAAVAAIDEPAARATAERGLERLRTARDGVTAAAGDPTALRTALSALGDTFAELTGAEAERRGGEVYAGRTLCHEETVRDLSIGFGPQVLSAVAAPMQIALQAARWLTVALADAYGAALRELYDDLAAGDRDSVPLSELWFLAQGLLFGDNERPVDHVAEEFARRAALLFDLDDSTLRQPRLSRTAEQLAGRVAELFAADRPGWRMGGVHSPDLQICASSVDAINAGDFSVVLGELHAAWPTFDCSVFLPGHDDPERLRAGLAADLGGPGRFYLLYPLSWPGHTGRTSHCLAHAKDWELAYADAPGARPDRSVPIGTLTVSEIDGELTVSGPGGRRWPLLELFAPMVSMHAVDGFKLLTTSAHTPRLSIDRLVLARETWRSTVGELELTTTRRGSGCYLAGRRMAARLGLPDQVFVRLSSETKPVFVDLTSPVYVSSLAAMVRSAQQRHGNQVGVTFSELLPGPDEAWVPDAAGRRYLSELRLQIVDPAPARTLGKEHS